MAKNSRAGYAAFRYAYKRSRLHGGGTGSNQVGPFGILYAICGSISIVIFTSLMPDAGGFIIGLIVGTVLWAAILYVVFKSGEKNRSQVALEPLYFQHKIGTEMLYQRQVYYTGGCDLLEEGFVVASFRSNGIGLVGEKKGLVMTLSTIKNLNKIDEQTVEFVCIDPKAILRHQYSFKLKECQAERIMNWFNASGCSTDVK